MSFIVKNYDLPQNCGECPCRGYDGHNIYDLETNKRKIAKNTDRRVTK